MAAPVVTVTAPQDTPVSATVSTDPKDYTPPAGSDASPDNQKPRLEKRHTVTLAMSKSMEKLVAGLPSQKKAMIRYGVYGLQGKRDAMEDAHVAVPICPPSKSPTGSKVGEAPAATAKPAAAPETAAVAASTTPVPSTATATTPANLEHRTTPERKNTRERKEKEKKEKEKDKKKRDDRKDKKEKKKEKDSDGMFFLSRG